MFYDCILFRLCQLKNFIQPIYFEYQNMCCFNKAYEATLNKYKFDDKDKVKIYYISNHHVQIYVSAAVEMMIGRLIACADR